MKFSQLPAHIQRAIAGNINDLNSNIHELTLHQVAELELESPQELFNRWLTWQGIMGWTTEIEDAYRAIYGDIEKLQAENAALRASLKKLFFLCEGEYPADQLEEFYPEVIEARDLLGLGVKPAEEVS